MLYKVRILTGEKVRLLFDPINWQLTLSEQGKISFPAEIHDTAR